MSKATDVVATDDTPQVTLSACCVMASSPDTSVTSTSFSEDRNINNVRFLEETQRLRVDDYDGEVTSSSEVPPSGIACCNLPLFEAHADENLNNLEDIDSLQATLSPLDGLLLADLTGGSHSTPTPAETQNLMMTEFCVDQDHDGIMTFSLKEQLNPMALETLAASHDSLLALAESVRPLSGDEWTRSVSDILGATDFSMDDQSQDQSHFEDQSSSEMTLLEHAIPDIVENVLALPEMQPEVEYTVNRMSDVNTLESYLLHDVTASSSCSVDELTSRLMLVAPCHSVTVSHSSAPLSCPYDSESLTSTGMCIDLTASDSVTSLSLMFDSTIPALTSMALPFNTPIMSAPLPSFMGSSGSAIIDSITAADLDARDLQELFQSTRLNHDIFLASDNDNQSALMLNVDSVAIDSLDDLRFIDLDGVAESRLQKLSGFPDESFSLDESDWTCVQNWSSSIMNNSSTYGFGEQSVGCETDQSVNDTDFNSDFTSRRNLRRSSRIQDNELRDLAQKIRQENQLKERLENEQLCSVEEAPVATEESSKLGSSSPLATVKGVERFPILADSKKMMSCGVELERVEILSLEKPSKSLKLKRKFSAESSGNSLKDSKKSKIEYIDDCITEAAESVDVKVEEPASKEMRPKSRSRKFKSYSVTLTTEEPTDGSNVPGKLKIKLRKIADESPISSPRQILVFPKADEFHVEAIQREAANSVTVKNEEENDNKDGVKFERSERQIMLSSTISDGNVGNLDKGSANIGLQVIPKSTKIKKIGIVKPVQKNLESPLESYDKSMIRVPSFNDTCVSESSKSGEKKAYAPQSCKKSTDEGYKVGDHLKNEFRRDMKSTKTDSKKDGHTIKSNEKKHTEQMKTSELKARKSSALSTESKETRLRKESSSVSNAGSRFMVLEEKSEADCVKHRRPSKDVKVVLNKAEEKIKKTSFKDADVDMYSSSICRGRRCQQLITSESVYCSDSCLRQHVLESVSLLSKDASTGSPTTEGSLKTDSSTTEQSDDRIVVFERSTGKLVTGQHAPTASNLLFWIRKHPTFEVLQSSQNPTSSKKNSKEKSDTKYTHVSSSKSKSSLSTGVNSDKNKKATVSSDNHGVAKTVSDKSHAKHEMSRSRADSSKGTSEQPQPTNNIEKEDFKTDKLPSGCLAAGIVTADLKDDNKKDSNDASRQHVRKGLCRALSARVPELNDVSAFRGTQLRRLAEKIEVELCNYYSGVNSLYQRKYRALVCHLTDSNNQGLFRRVIYSYLKPAELVQINSQLLGSERWSQWPPEKQSSSATPGASVAVCKSMTAVCSAPTPAANKSVASVGSLKNGGDLVSLVNVDSTSCHGQHVFDVNCRICMNSSLSDSAEAQLSSVTARIQRAKELHNNEPVPTFPSANLFKVTRPALDASQFELSSEAAEFTLPTCSVTAVKSSFDSTKLTTTFADPRRPALLEDVISKSVTAIMPPVNLPVFSSAVTVGPQSPVDELPLFSSTTAPAAAGRNIQSYQSPYVDEIVWSGSIVAQDVSTFKTIAHRVSGSMKIMKHELPESLTVMGRIPPDIVCDYLNKIRRAPVVTREIAIVFFTADENGSDVDGYDQLFKYLVERQRCAVFGSIGDSIKDMYLWPLARKSCVPSMLLPFTKPGLPIDRKDVLLGVVVQHLSNRYHVKRTVPESEIMTEQNIITRSLQLEDDIGEDVRKKKNGALDDESDISRQSNATVEQPVSTFVTSSACNKLVNKTFDDEPYEPVDDDANSCLPTSAQPNADPTDLNTCEQLSDAAISTERRLLAAFGDKAEVERFTVCIDRLLEMVKRKSAKKNTAAPGDAKFLGNEVSDQKRQLLMQLNGIIKRKARSSAEQNTEVSGQREDTTSTNKDTREVGDVCGTEMDKFLAWKARLEGLSSHKSAPVQNDCDRLGPNVKNKSFSCKVFTVPVAEIADKKCPPVVEQIAQTAQVAEYGDVKSEKMPSSGESMAAAAKHFAGTSVSKLAVSLSSDVSTLLKSSYHHLNVTPDIENQVGPGSDSQVLGEDKPYDLEQENLLVGSPFSLPSPVSDGVPEIIADRNFPPLPTPPKPPDNLLKINFDFCPEVPFIPLALPQFRDTSIRTRWHIPDDVSSRGQGNRNEEAEMISSARNNSFTPCSPPSASDCDYADHVRKSADKQDLRIGKDLFVDAVPSLSMPPYLLAAPLNSPTMQNSTSMAEMASFKRVDQRRGIVEEVNVVQQPTLEVRSSLAVKSLRGELGSDERDRLPLGAASPSQQHAGGRSKGINCGNDVQRVQYFRSSDFDYDRSTDDSRKDSPISDETVPEHVAEEPRRVLKTECDDHEGVSNNIDERLESFENPGSGSSDRLSVDNFSLNNFSSSSKNPESKMSLDDRLQHLFSSVESSVRQNAGKDDSHDDSVCSSMSIKLDSKRAVYPLELSTSPATSRIGDGDEVQNLAVSIFDAIESSSKGDECQDKRENTSIPHSLAPQSSHRSAQCVAVYGSHSTESFTGRNLVSTCSKVSHSNPALDSCLSIFENEEYELSKCRNVASDAGSWNAVDESCTLELYRSSKRSDLLRASAKDSTADKQVDTLCLRENEKLLSSSRCSATSQIRRRDRPSKKSEISSEFEGVKLSSVAFKEVNSRSEWLNDTTAGEAYSSDVQPAERDWKHGRRSHGMEFQRYKDVGESDRGGGTSDSFNPSVKCSESKGYFFRQSMCQRSDDKLVSPVVQELSYLPAPPRIPKLLSPRARDFMRDNRSISIDESLIATPAVDSSSIPPFSFPICLSPPKKRSSVEMQSSQLASNSSYSRADVRFYLRHSREVSPLQNPAVNPGYGGEIWPRNPQLLEQRVCMATKDRVNMLESQLRFSESDMVRESFCQSSNTEMGFSKSADVTRRRSSAQSRSKFDNPPSCDSARSSSRHGGTFGEDRKHQKQHEVGIETISDSDKVVPYVPTQTAATSTRKEFNDTTDVSNVAEELEEGEIVDSADECASSPPRVPPSHKLLPPPKLSDYSRQSVGGGGSGSFWNASRNDRGEHSRSALPRANSARRSSIAGRKPH